MIVEMEDKHNHDLEVERFASYPESRRRPSLQILAAGLGFPMAAAQSDASEPISEDDDFSQQPPPTSPNAHFLATFSSCRSEIKPDAPTYSTTAQPEQSTSQTNVFPLTVCVCFL